MSGTLEGGAGVATGGVVTTGATGGTFGTFGGAVVTGVFGPEPT